MFSIEKTIVFQLSSLLKTFEKIMYFGIHFGIMLVPFSHTFLVFFGINFCMDV